jgi:subtilisin family serine protease
VADASVSVAIVDSGVSVPHPHLPAVAGGVWIDLRGEEHEDYADRLGHGTAVAAAIHEKAPSAEIYAVKIFEEGLATSVPTLVRAIDWASERGVRLVNLSLGTPNDFRANDLAPAVERAIERGTIIVAAHEYEGQPMYPGCLEGVVGVMLRWDHARDAVTPVALESGGSALIASGYPRPIPGVPPERNLSGISFAVANATGVLAAALAGMPGRRSAESVIDLLRAEAED